MNTTLILKFLTEVAANNNREWFKNHKAKYEQAKGEFEQGVTQLIQTIAKFDPSIAHLTAKDCCYRFYRDIRFSPDKAPYKRHFGAYIAAHGKRHCTVDTTFICNPTIACWQSATIGCPLTS